MKFEFSAGGVVYKKERDKILVLVSRHAGHHGWVFPKGLIGDKEENKHQTKEETAIREVKEETGIDAEIEKPLKPITFWYVWEGEKRKKTVYYFVMKHLGGSFDESDDEMEEIEWIDYNDVPKRLTYPSEKKVWDEAKSLII